MVDTVRDLSYLLGTTFADGQTAGISANDLRDLLVSTLGQSGWADYSDTANTDGSPQALAANTANVVTINGVTSQKQELPIGVTDFWSANKIVVDNPGTSLMISFEAKIRRASGTGRWAFDTYIDIGLPGFVPLYAREITVDNGGDAKNVGFTTGVYCLDTWVANGGELIINPEIAAELFGARIVIHQLHRGRGTY